jgi:hypothetical protein
MKKTILGLLFATMLCPLGAISAMASDRQAQASPMPTATVADVKSPSTFFYADKLVYTPGQRVTLKLTQNGGLNPIPFQNAYTSYFIYLENLQTGEKRYHPGFQNQLPVTDIYGQTANADSGNYPIYRVPTLTGFTFFGPGGELGDSLPVPSTPGSYRYVMELRDQTGTYIQSQGFAPFTVVESIETLSGTITTDRTLSNRKAYILSGMVFVQTNATLTIEPGTILFGDGASLGGLCITPGSKINAVGTPSRPIVFTSSAAIGSRRAGDWFGVALAGRAPINVSGGTAQVEGIETVQYGGSNPDDNSGIMRYVRIEYAGIRFTPTREANGLYLNGVGRGTVLEYLHFNNNSDDNIEFFGGTAQVKYVFCTGGEDDQLDWTEGWSGKAQFVITQVYQNTGANRGIEADNWETNNDATPRSNPLIYNMTIVGPQQNYSEGEGKADHGLMLRRGTAGRLHNFIVIGYGRDAINMRDSATINQANAGNLVFDNAILYNNGVFGADGVGDFGNTDTQNWIQSKSQKVLTGIDPRLIDPYNRLTPDYRPGYLSPAMRIDVVKRPPDDGFFTPVDFVGGMGPDNNWLAGGWVHITPN